MVRIKTRFLTVYLFCLFVLVSSLGNFYAQTVAGKIFTKDEADKLFGPVLESYTMSAEQFSTLLNKSGNAVMFSFSSNNLHILDAKRNVLFSNGQVRVFSSSEVLKYYSVSVAQELLSKGKSSVIVIEKREKVLSITNGVYTMEDAVDCPPWCPS